ncbi:MAG: 2-oxo acid dehydrogenase subunit E2 [Bacteroidetes bacterium]|nr:2-oxo acid dehydrogenase subunit E2 [Bacteroidota bacterium]
MAEVELIMPKMGESVHEATIIKWLKNEGDKIALDEPVLEIATDKVDSEIPSTAEGTLSKKLFKEGEVVQVGKPIAIISTAAAETISVKPKETPSVSKPQIQTPSKNGEPVAAPVPESASAERVSSSGKPALPAGRFYSPLVKNIARQEGISIAELETISGTGKDGRVTKHDILDYVPRRKKDGVKKVSTPLHEISAPQVFVSPNDEIIEMDRMRKLIAEHMVMSKRVSPHVTSYVEADVTNLVKWRDKIKASFEKREGEKITFTPVFIEAVVNAIKDFPMVNVSVDGTKIIVRKNINIGMAAALPSGNLIVPVIKNADRYNLFGLTKTVNDLAARARANKLLPDEVQGGTFTLTNVGVFGNVMGAPIINQPQAAILATGVIKKKPVVMETEFGDSIVIRSMMFLSLSYDHRVVDGMLGGSFLRRAADYLEKFDASQTI